jgi:hypothetical protein
MFSKNGSSKTFQVFICHESTTGHDFALNLKTSLEKMNYSSFVAPDDMKGAISDEREYRYKVLRESEYFIIIVTKLLLINSPEAKSEIEEALKLKKHIIPCINNLVDLKQFECVLPNVSKMQCSFFKNDSELANNVTNKITDMNLKNEETKMHENVIAEELFKEDLLIKPAWSLKKVARRKNKGHIIFRLKNLSEKTIIIYGYRIFRIKPDGLKDVYYYSSVCDATNFKKWVSDPHTKIILHKNDEHVFHWDDVNIMEVYGINEIGKWLTEVQVAYIQEGSKNIYYSIGTTEIEFYA